MQVRMAKTYCYEHQGAYLWAWQDYAGAWQARAGFRGEEKRCSRPLRIWGDVWVFLADLSASYLSENLCENAKVLYCFAEFGLSGQARFAQPLTDALVSGLKSLPCLAVVADDGSYAHLYQDGPRWHLWAENGGSGLTFRCSGVDPVRLLARLIESGAGLPPALLRQLLLALGPEEPVKPAEPPPAPAPRPLPTNLAERFGALVADLLAEGGAHEDLGHQLLCLAAGEDLPREPVETRQEGWWQDCERDARDAFAAWLTCWQPGVTPPQFGGTDISLDWGWQTAGRPHVWWGESSDDAEGAALAESARLGRAHRLVRVVAQTEVAPRGHWRMRPVGGEE